MQLNSITGISPDQRTFKEDSSWILPSTFIGVECEGEGMGNYRRVKAPKYWDVKEDGSLRNGGGEFVLSQPLNGKDLTDALDLYQKKAEGIGMVHSARTSIHIHLDVRDMSVSQLVTLIGIYMICEQAIYHYHQNVYKRSENIYCLPFYKAQGHLRDLGGITAIFNSKSNNDSKRRRIQQSLQRLNKYYGLNLASLFTFGSLEFRHMEGTNSSASIKEWINIIMCLKKFALEYNKHPSTILTTVSTEGIQKITSLFPPALRAKLFSYRGYEGDIYDGMRLFQDIVFNDDIMKAEDRYQKAIYKVNPESKTSKRFLAIYEKEKKSKSTTKKRTAQFSTGGLPEIDWEEARVGGGREGRLMVDGRAVAVGENRPARDRQRDLENAIAQLDRLMNRGD